MDRDLIPDEPLQGKLIRNGFRLYFFQFLVAPAGYLIKMMVSRELSVEDIGLFYSIMGLIGIISAYNDLGLTEALQYYLPHYFIDKEYSKAKTIIVFTWIMQFISGFIISGILYFGSDWIAASYFKTLDASLLLKYFALYFIILNLFQVILSMFVAIQNIKRQQGIESIRMRTIVLLTFLSSYRGLLDTVRFTQLRLIGVIVALIGSRRGLKNTFGWLFRDHPMVWDRQLIQQQWSYGLLILIGVGAWTLLVQVNQQFALYFFGKQAAGYRANYLSFYTIASIIIGPIIGYLFPLLNELYKKGEQEKIKLLYRLLFGGTVLFGVVGGVVGYLFSESAAVFLFGEKFRESGVLFQHYAPFLITLPLIGILFQDIASRGMVKQRVRATVYALCANGIFSICFGKYFGLTGLVYGQLMGNIVLLMCGRYRRNKKTI